MPRCFSIVVALAVTLCPLGQVLAGQGDLIPETTAARHGLTRPWFAQLELAQERSRVSDIIFSKGVLFVQSDTAMVQAIDGETGKTLWARQIGRSTQPSVAAGANANLLVVVNGSRLYAVNRKNGNLLYETPLDRAPGAGIAVSAQRAYVPMVNGMIASYSLQQSMDLPEATDSGKKDSPTETAPQSQKASDKETNSAPDLQPTLRLPQERVVPLMCQSVGRVLVKPLITQESSSEEYVAWCTDQGYLNIGLVNRNSPNILLMKYRLETEAPIVCAAAYMPPDPQVVGDSGVVFVASQNGFVHAVLEKTGNSLWRFPTGESIIRSPVVIRDRLFVATEIGGMYCLNAKTGQSIWCAPDVVQFVAAGRSRIYGIDSLNRMVALDPDNGALVDTIPTENIPFKFCNDETDRIYFANERGLVQCLHEIELTEPITYRPEIETVVEQQPAEEEKPAVRQRTESKPAAASRTPLPRKEPAEKKARASAKKAKGGVNGASDPNAPSDAFGGAPRAAAPENRPRRGMDRSSDPNAPR